MQIKKTGEEMLVLALLRTKVLADPAGLSQQYALLKVLSVLIRTLCMIYLNNSLLIALQAGAMEIVLKEDFTNTLSDILKQMVWNKVFNTLTQLSILLFALLIKVFL
jgi:hypothetical protein